MIKGEVKRFGHWLWLVPTLVLGAIYRLYNLTAIALWHDEAFSVLMVEYPFKEMLYRLTLDVHPPAYYALFYGWNKLFGNSLFSLRFFSVVFGILAIIVIYWLVRKILNPKLAVITSLVAAVNPFLVLYSQEGRMYAFGVFILLAAVLSLWYILREKRFICWVFFTLFSIIAIYIHYYLLFSVFALFLVLVYKIYRDEEHRGYWLKGTIGWLVVSFLAYLPWLPHFFSQLGQVQESYWIPEMSAWSVPNTLVNLLTGGVLSLGEGNWQVAVVLIAIIVYLFYRGIRYIFQKSRDGGWIILISFLTPFILAILLSVKQSLYLDRYFIFIVPFYLIILTTGIYSLKEKSLRNALIALTVIFMSLFYFQHWQNINPSEKPGMAGAEDYLTINYEPGDKIIATSSFVYFTFDYYNQTSAHPKLYAPGELSHFSGTALLDDEDIVKDFNRFADSGEVVWMVGSSGWGGFRPEPPANWEKLSEKEFPDSNGVKGSVFISQYLVK